MQEPAAAVEKRNAFVDGLVKDRAITTERVEAAMRAVPRHRLLREIWIPGRSSSTELQLDPCTVDPVEPDDQLLARIYSDLPIVTKLRDGRATSSTSQPSLVAQMLEFLELRPGMWVLEIGAGTGYNAALIAEVVGSQELVTTVDIQAEVVAQARLLLAEAGYPGVSVICSDGAFGHPDRAPFDRVIATVGCSDIAPAWLEQLAPAGFALIPLEHLTVGHPLTHVTPSDGGDIGRVVAPAGFMRIEGALHDARPRQSWAGVRRDEERRSPVPPELASVTGPWGGPAWDFLYYLRLADPRSGPGLMLADAEGSVGVELGGAELLESGDNGDLLDELLAHVAAWRELGRPAASDWRSTFIRLGNELPSDVRYRVDRIHYTQLAALS